MFAVCCQWAGSAGVLVANSSDYFEADTEHGAGGKMGKHPVR